MTHTTQNEETYKFNCAKCGAEFVINHDPDTDKPICNKCFKELVSINTYEGYKSFSEDI